MYAYPFICCSMKKNSLFSLVIDIQENVTISCENTGPLEDLCFELEEEDLSDFSVLSVATAFDNSCPNGEFSVCLYLFILLLVTHVNLLHYYDEVMYAMFEATSTAFDDPDFVKVRASSEDSLSELDGVDICFHTSFIANMRAKEANTITYLADNVSRVDTTWTVPLPRDWCSSGGTSEWR